MGYTTDFKGAFTLDKPLTKKHIKDLNAFANERHEGPGYPGIWCQWVPNEDGDLIEWDGGEKFYNYEDWIVWLIENKLKPWGYVLNGTVHWNGEDDEDSGVLEVSNNEVVSHNIFEQNEDLLQGLDHVLRLSKDRLPLFMGINKTLDKKLLKLMSEV
jgi:hypothetical protein